MRRVVIVGGVAGGASCAARLRRLDEDARIVLLERGEYISYANCGLPYHVGDVIRSRAALLVMPEETMRSRFAVDVRTRNEVVSIDRTRKVVTVRRVETGEEYEEPYDTLVLATGSSPLRPPIPGIESPRVRTLWTVPDTDELRSIVRGEGGRRQARTAVVVGGGFIGLEMAENLRHAGLEVTIVEALDQVMAPLDPEMAQLLHENIVDNGVALHLGDGVSSFEDDGERVTVRLASGASVTADLVILSVGVRPNGQIAQEAGLATNARGGIVVDDHMRTNDPAIYAVGDVVEVRDLVSGEPTMVPLAGPANKQGRIAANNIAGTDDTYTGTQGTSVAQVFDLNAASTGASEKALQRRGLVRDKDYRTVTITQNSHAGYYPGAEPLTLKLIFSPDGTRIFGAQIVGRGGVDKRIDVLATTLRLGGGIEDLTDLELAYAPPFSSAKDPVNMAGFVAQNLLAGLVDIAAWDEPDSGDVALLDVREAVELQARSVPGATHIPLGELRDRMGELDPSRRTIVFCAVGVRAYNAARMLQAHGFSSVAVYPGGVRFFEVTHFDVPSAVARLEADRSQEASEGSDDTSEGDQAPPGTAGAEAGRPVSTIRVDCCGMQCPGPIMRVGEGVGDLGDDEQLEVVASDPGFAKDIVAWCRRTGNTLVSNERRGTDYVAVVRKGVVSAPASDDSAPASGRASSPREGKTIIVFSGDLDKVMAAFIIANGAAAMGRPVTMFFTFWGLTALRRPTKVQVAKSGIERMFGAMLPRGAQRLGLSRMNMLGMGARMMRSIMASKNVSSLPELMQSAMAAGVKIIACTMSMDVMGIHREELIDGIEYAGVGTYLGDAEESDVNLFI